VDSAKGLIVTRTRSAPVKAVLQNNIT